MRLFCIAALLLATTAAQAATDEATERAAIVAAVQKLFDAMATADGDMAAEVLIPEGRLIIVTQSEEGVAFRAWDHADFITTVASGENVLVERMWDPEVELDGPVATFRARYDFYRDGTYSHCGVDLFTMVRADEGWRISGGSFTRDTGICPDNPLPPL